MAGEFAYVPYIDNGSRAGGSVEDLTATPGSFLDTVRGGLSVLSDTALLGLNAYGTFQTIRSGAATGATRGLGAEYVYDPIPARPIDGSPNSYERDTGSRNNTILVVALIGVAIAAVVILRKG